jgi:hypothetical protein
MELVHCIYCSVLTSGELDPGELSALLDKCRSNNANFDVTGMLLYQHHSFFQVLEGDRSTVESLFEKIALDPRHKRITKVILEPISEREFGNWTMGYPQISSKELAEIPGLNDFFRHATSYLELGEGRAKTLLAAFKDGKWRARLS